MFSSSSTAEPCEPLISIFFSAPGNAAVGRFDHTDGTIGKSKRGNCDIFHFDAFVGQHIGVRRSLRQHGPINHSSKSTL
jgi:hypothetical protein